ncbi:hypothetical protein ACMZ5A_25890 [Bacillus mobilis]
METTKTSLIQILWDGPYSITDLVKLKNEEIDYENLSDLWESPCVW